MSRTTGKISKVYDLVSPRSASAQPVHDSQDLNSNGTMFSTQSWFNRIVQGSTTRFSRYLDYDNMDSDIEVARALDTIADEMVPEENSNGLPFVIKYKNTTEAVDTAVADTIRSALIYWSDIHKWNVNKFPIVRNTLKYGDYFFRKQENDYGGLKPYIPIHPKNVLHAIVDANDVTKVIGWQIRVDNKEVNQSHGVNVGISNQTDISTEIVPADEIIHFNTLTDLSDSAPFGLSVLHPVYRTYRQLQYMTDSMVIYRITRAPERRVFNIYTGRGTAQQRKQILEQFKNEMRQKKIPYSNSSGSSVESIYDPESIQDDFFFAVGENGTPTTIDTLPGGTGLGDISEIEYFLGKLYRGLRVPVSYMNVTPSSAQQPIFNDGQMGSTYVEEYQFSKWCRRLQMPISETFDRQFKLFLSDLKLQIDLNSFSIELPEPKNLGLYRQLESDKIQLSLLSEATEIPVLSKRFAMRRFGQMSEDEIRENERMKGQEMGIDPNSREFMRVVYGTGDEESISLGGDIGGFGGVPDMSSDMVSDDVFGEFDAGAGGESGIGGEEQDNEENE